jgi:hypothetical protein
LNKSRYFAELIKSYNDEVDDLVSDSAGKSVLQQRLNVKRREIGAILPMIEYSPEMVAVVFYDAFDFKSPGTMQQVVLSEPDDADFTAWDDLKGDLTVADWAVPLIESALKAKGGDAFLVTSVALEFLRTRTSSYEPEPELLDEDDQGDDSDDGDAGDLGEAGADWLSEQGFEPLDR